MKRENLFAAGIIAVAIVLHALLPRYSHAGGRLILDRWTGRLCAVSCHRAPAPPPTSYVAPDPVPAPMPDSGAMMK